MRKPAQSSVGRQLLFVFEALCLVLVLIGALFFFSLRAIEHRRQTQQARAHEKWEVMDKLPRNVGLRQAEVFHHVLETNVEEMARHDQIIRELDEASARILSDFEMLLDGEKERHLFARLMQARKVYMERTEELLVLSRANRDAEKTSAALTKQSPAYFEYHRAANELIEEVEENALQSRADTSRLIWQLGRYGGVIVGLAVLLTLGTGFMVVLRITRRLRADNVTLQTEIAERKLAEKKILAQLDELRRWQEMTLGREDRVLELKREVNKLYQRLGEPARYASQTQP